jgi:hypothetical protein
MPTFAEEFMLLALSDPQGAFLHEPAERLENAIAGAILMDLALLGRIDTDLEGLVLIDAAPTGDPLLDKVLGLIEKFPAGKSTAHWIEEIRYRSGQYRDILVGRLVESGRLEKKEKKLLGIIPRKRYTVSPGGGAADVRERLRATILGDDIPDPRDVLLISLLVSCNLIDRLCSLQEREGVRERLEAISRMDLIGQAVYKTILQEIVIPVSY